MPRGGGLISQNHNALTAMRMIQVRAVLIQASLDLQVGDQIRGAELREVCVEWFQEQNGSCLIPHEALLIRAANQSVLAMNQTLGELGVENNEVFYLF